MEEELLFFYSKIMKESKMNTNKQAQAYLNNLRFQGETQSGQTQQLKK